MLPTEPEESDLVEYRDSLELVGRSEAGIITHGSSLDAGTVQLSPVTAAKFG